jgi:hypothetical protein
LKTTWNSSGEIQGLVAGVVLTMEKILGQINGGFHDGIAILPGKRRESLNLLGNARRESHFFTRKRR